MACSSLRSMAYGLLPAAPSAKFISYMPYAIGHKEEIKMPFAKTLLKTVVVVLSVAAIFAAGYFWAMKTMDHTPNSKAAANPEKMDGMANMPGMAGMEGMAPGMITISPEKQQLTGVRTAVVER